MGRVWEIATGMGRVEGAGEKLKLATLRTRVVMGKEGSRLGCLVGDSTADVKGMVEDSGEVNVTWVEGVVEEGGG